MKSTLDSYIEEIKSWSDEPDITFVEISDRLNKAGIKTSETAVRRFFKRNRLPNPGQKKDTGHLARAIRDTQGTITVEDKLRDEIDSLRKENKEAEQVIKRLRENQLFEDKVLGAIDTALKNKANELSSPTLSRPKFETQGSSNELLLLISDAHYGEVVNPEEALGIKYDPEVCRQRLEHLRDTTLQIAALKSTSYPIQKITLASLGDMVGGMIHDELEVTNQLTMTEQTSEMAHILLDFSKDMLEVFPEVELVIRVGNHPRLHKKPRYKQKYDNWEFIMGQMIKGMARYALPDLTVTVPKDMIYVHDVFNYKVGMVHGDGVKSNSFAGIPFYGLRNQREAVQALMSQTGKTRIDMFVMGHFHQYVFWSGECDIIINGAIKGGDEFGIGTRLSAPEPEQILLEWHNKFGNIAKHRIKLSHIGV